MTATRCHGNPSGNPRVGEIAIASFFRAFVITTPRRYRRRRLSCTVQRTPIIITVLQPQTRRAHTEPRRARTGRSSSSAPTLGWTGVAPWERAPARVRGHAAVPGRAWPYRLRLVSMQIVTLQLELQSRTYTIRHAGPHGRSSHEARSSSAHALATPHIHKDVSMLSRTSRHEGSRSQANHIQYHHKHRRAHALAAHTRDVHMASREMHLTRNRPPCALLGHT